MINYAPRYCLIFTIVVFALCLYGNTIGYEYALDDQVVIVKNRFTQMGANGIGKLIAYGDWYGYEPGNYSYRYRPLAPITYALEYHFFGKNPHVSHAINVALYALTGIVLFGVLQSCFADVQMPFLITLLFLGHPAHTEVVANIKGREEIICFLLLLASIHFSLRYARDSRYGIGALLCFGLALFAKESAITFVVVIPLVLYFFTDISRGPNMVLALSLALVAAIYLGIRTSILGSMIGSDLQNPLADVTIWRRLPTAIAVLGEYIALLIFPLQLQYIYDISILNWSDLQVVVTCAICLLLIGYSLSVFRSKDIYAFAILYFFITISIVANIFVVTGITMAERVLYTPSLGFCMILAAFASKISAKRRLLLAIGVGLLLSAYFVRTTTRNWAWKDNYTLFSEDIVHLPNSSIAHLNLAEEYCKMAANAGIMRNSNLNRALHYVDRAIELNADYARPWYLRGRIFQQQGAENWAEAMYKKAIAVDPGYGNSYLMLSAIYRNKGNYQLAKKYYQKNLEYNPFSTTSWYYLGLIYQKHGDSAAAQHYYRQAIKIDPYDVRSYLRLGDLYRRTENYHKAILQYQEALRYHPHNARVYLQLGLVYEHINDYQKSIACYRQALTANSDYAPAFFNIANVYNRKGNYDKAIFHYQRAIACNSKYAQAYYNLGVLYYRRRDIDKAEHYLCRAYQIDHSLVDKRRLLQTHMREKR